MKQYRITASDIVPQEDNDAYLAPEDPVHELKAASALGGLGGMERLMDYRAQQRTPVVGSNKGQIQREQGIKPGTEEWFKLWFGQNNK
jgi:hypothetical protein